MFDPVDPKQSLPALENGILRYWKEEDIFKRSMRQRQRQEGDVLDGSKEGKGDVYSFYDGPPFATGLPHYGHLLAGTIKDVIPRYQTMKGKYVQRRFGWDCHGLPIENIIEKENDINGPKEIQEMGIGAFNALCRAGVLRFTGEWKKVVERMGRWVDMDWDYRTMDPDYMESIWWVFSQLHEKGLIYEGHKPMHICPHCSTPLSNFEVTQAYKDITDHSVTAMFELTDEPNTFVLAWTTTPWTLPGNLFLAVGKKITYVKVESDGKTFILAKDLVESVFKDRDHTVKGELKAKDLLGKTYVPLFPYFVKEYEKNAFRIVDGDFVTTEEGTGVVHIAPGFGEDDFNVGKKEKVPLLQHVTMSGQFTDAVTDFAGDYVKPADDPTKADQKIAQYLEKHDRLFAIQKYKHSYPHCWRCDSPLLNYATSSWFVSVEKIKDDILQSNAQTSWVPSHIRDGRFGNWLENARDWAISRNRYWGTPLPIWRNEETSDLTVIASRQELMNQNKIRFTKVSAVRHGESEGNLTPIYQGKEPGTDLTDRGKQQAKTAATFLNDEGVDIIYCSPLARAQQTAQAIADATGAKVVVDERLREVEFGEYEGKTVDFSDLLFVRERRAHKIDNEKPESIYHFPGMETWESVQSRIADFMNEVLPRHRSEHVVIVTHADPVQNLRHFFTKEDPIKISHQPYPQFATPETYFWDHNTQAQMDLHKETVDDVMWPGSKSKKSVEVTLVRHGETDWNKEKKIQGGGADPSLNDTGRAQALDTAKKLKGMKFDAVVASDRKRAYETAEIIAKELGISDIEKLDVLQERFCGEWSGQSLESVVKKYPSHVTFQNASMHFATPDKGESLSEFLTRIQKAYGLLLEKYAGKKVLVVSHRGTMHGLMSFVENQTYQAACEYGFKNAEAVTATLHPLLKRIPEVLDCWFESGSMPYAQPHYPHNFPPTKEPPSFPADFIAEGLDQTRGWFYTLTVLGAALFKKSPFRNCVVNGIVLASDGKKMSKKLKNYPEPMEIVEKYGADAIRFTLMNSPAVRGENLRMDEKLVEENMRSVILPLWNTYSFFVTYANACNFEPVDNRRHSAHPLDLWIRAEVQDLANRMTEQMDNYDLSATCDELHDTIDAITNWYVRLSRRRFAGKDCAPEEQTDALNTLYDVLLTLSQLLAPFCPYITDAIYLNLVPEHHGSVHLTDWPETRKLTKEEQMLLAKNRLMRSIVSLGLKVRGEQTIKVRQPLNKAMIALSPAMLKEAHLTEEDHQLLMQEMNVKDLEFADDPESLAETIVQVDARVVGPRLGGRVQDIIKAGKEGEFAVQDDGSIMILDEVLSPDEAQIVYRGKEGQNIAADKGIVVSVDTEITEELQTEGLARDIIRTVQRLRKEQGLSFTDHIVLHVKGADDVMKMHGKLIASETRATLGENKGESFDTDLEGNKVTIAFEKK